MKIRSLAIAGLFAIAAARCGATVISEHFTNDPALDGWQSFGDTNLFTWNSASNTLDVTWDSSQPNSYFYHPLGTTLNSTNDFMLAFDLNLNDIAVGTTMGKPQTFQVAIGLLNLAEATNDGFIIGTGYQASDIAEFDYFPDSGYGATVSTPIISSEGNFSVTGFTFPLALVPGALYHAVLSYTAANQTFHTVLTSNGIPIGPMQDTTLGVYFDDFNLDTFSVNSYTDAGQDTNAYASTYTNQVDGMDVITTNYTVYAGSLLAHGTVDKLSFGSPLPVVQISSFIPPGLQFSGEAGWIYTLERSADLQSWTDVSLPATGVDGAMTLSDTNPPPDKAFYRLRAELP